MSENVGYGPPLTLAGGGTVAGTAAFTGTVSFSNTVTHTANLVMQGANGETWTSGFTSEILSISTSATTDTAANLLPANSEIKAVVVRVLQTIPTAATFTVGDPTTAARFATGVAVAANTQSVGILQVGSTGVTAATPIQSAAAKVRITPNAAPGTSTGQLRITVFWETFGAPTS